MGTCTWKPSRFARNENMPKNTERSVSEAGEIHYIFGLFLIYLLGYPLRSSRCAQFDDGE